MEVAVMTALTGINTVFLVGVAYSAGKVVQRLTHVETEVQDVKRILKADILHRRNGGD
jgi:hypothetical protein